MFRACNLGLEPCFPFPHHIQTLTMSHIKIYYSDHLLEPEEKDVVAAKLTDLYADLCDTPAQAVKIIFHSLGLWSFWSGGHRAQMYVHVEAKVKKAISGKGRFALLRETHDVVKAALNEKGEKAEIQTQVLELEASEGTMTNGQMDPWS